MKKVILAASLLALSMGVYAQEAVVTTAPVVEVEGAKNYKPVQGDLLAEIGLFGGDVVNLPSSTFGTPQLKFRYFLQDKIAIRAGINLSQHAETNKIYGPNGETGSQTSTNSIWGVNGGLEKHFAGTGRLSTYVGADVSVQITNAAGKRENTADGINYASGESQKIRGYNYANGATSAFGFGLRAVTGADYYFVDKVYLGAEFGWGFMAMQDGRTKTETTTGGVTTTVETKTTGGSFDLMPSLTAGVRIGYRF